MGKKKTYVVTSAQKGGVVNNEVFIGIKKYAAERNAPIEVIELQGRRKNSNEELDAKLEEFALRKNLNLNKKIKIKESYSIKPQKVIPPTGLARLAQSDVSTILGSPKQFMQVVPNSNQDLPKIFVTTGSITHPNYAPGSETTEKAEFDHKYGFVVVETDGPTNYHFRQVRALKSGAFVDLGQRYNGRKKKTSASLEAMILGDWHRGDTNAKVREVTFNMISELKPKRIVIHDYFNGHSISHHEKDKPLTLARRARRGELSLEKELRLASKELYAINDILGGSAEILYVIGNHDEFLDRWVDNKRWLEDPYNSGIGAELFAKLVRNDDGIPVEEGLRAYGGVPNTVKFLPRDSDYKVLGWQLAVHGDKGAGGSRNPSPRALEEGHGKIIVGHRHKPGRWRDVIHVGTSTDIPLDYSEGGLGGWMNTHGLLYHTGGSYGHVQLVNIIDGKWRNK